MSLLPNHELAETGPSPSVDRDERQLEPVRAAGQDGWLIAAFRPTALFALKISAATSSVGKTHVVPTMYAIKMAIVDAAFRAGIADEQVMALVRALVTLPVRVAPPICAVVSHTFLKVRQEPKDTKENLQRPYISSIAYREFVHLAGPWHWAFGLASMSPTTAEQLTFILPHVNYIGKRGSFVQFEGFQVLSDLDAMYCQPVGGSKEWQLPALSHIAQLDDFGPEASLEVLSTFSPQPVKRAKHRCFVPTIVPLGIVNTGPGFTEYRRREEGSQ